jgi:hypothetical protein
VRDDRDPLYVSTRAKAALQFLRLGCCRGRGAGEMCSSVGGVCNED